MKLAFVTDNHFDSGSRFEETIRIHEWIAQDAAERGCGGTLLGGDLYERRSNPDERNAAGAWLIRMATFGTVIGVKGNHEAEGDLDLLNLLEAQHPIRFHAQPALDAFDGVLVACIPWPRRANLLAQLTDGANAGNAASEALRAVFRGLGSRARDSGLPLLALGHVMIDGASTDHDQPIVGADMAVSLADLALLDADLYACGHVHAQQGGMIGDAPWLYGGAPRHNNFGEPGPKGYVVIEVEPGRSGRVVGFERIPTPATPMVLVSDEWGFDDGFGRDVFLAGAHGLPDSVRGAEIRFRYRVAADRRDAARLAASRWRDDWLAEGALSVKVEEQVVAATRARVPEIALARTTAEKLVALRTSKGEQLDAARTARLDEKLSQLEQEVRNAS